MAAAGCATTSSPTSQSGPSQAPVVITGKPLKPSQAEISARVAQELKELGEKESGHREEAARLPSPTSPSTVTYDIPIVINSRVEYFIDYFQTRVPKRFRIWLSRSGRYLPMMRAILKEHGLPEDLVYLALIESGFSCQAYSRAHAVGPWQFIRGTGRRYGLKINYWVDERRDPVKATHAAAAISRTCTTSSAPGIWPPRPTTPARPRSAGRSSATRPTTSGPSARAGATTSSAKPASTCPR